MKRKRFSEKLHRLNKRKWNAGETLVEVMVSAVIFLLLVAVLQGSVAFCTNAQKKSREIRADVSSAIEAYWTAKDSGALTSGNGDSETLTFRTKDGGTAFSIDVTLDSNTVSTGNDSEDGSGSSSVTFYTFGTKTSSGD